MNSPHIVWRGLDPSEALDARIRQELQKLAQHADTIIASRVVTERTHDGFEVTIELTVPGRVLTVSESPPNRDAYAAVNEAFAKMKRRLDDYTHLRHGE